MTLQQDLDRLKADLERKRKELEQQMCDSTLSRANTDDLAERIRDLRKRMRASAETPVPEAPLS